MALIRLEQYSLHKRFIVAVQVSMSELTVIGLEIQKNAGLPYSLKSVYYRLGLKRISMLVVKCNG